MENETHTGVIESLFDRTTDYLETRAELVKLKAIRKGAEVASALISRVIIGVLACLFIMMLSIGLALWIGAMLEKTYLGFFIIAAVYLIAGLIIYSGRNKWLKMPVANSIIKKIHS